jgi:1,4-alpha-glucan branching enzyme
MVKGHLALVLHAHLPFVRHPEHPFFLEEEWLYEAITETYLPLLDCFEKLASDGVPFRLTLSLSPTLLAMLGDDLLRRRYERHLEHLRALVEREIARTKRDAKVQKVALHYREQLSRADQMWQHLAGNLPAAFARLQRQGYLDILTCAATHGYLPLMRNHPAAVRAQIRTAVQQHKQVIGVAPTGIWLPECGYYPGLDAILAEEGLRYFVADAHAVHFSRPRPRNGTYAPVFCAGSGVALFPRDHQTSVQVWSRRQGYPGDPAYREFYRDIGFDLPMEALANYLQPPGMRKHTGIKYHRITGSTSAKETYCVDLAKEKAAEHAANFMFNREKQIEHHHDVLERDALVVAPYDAELFGHWWYEGPWWIDYFCRKSAYDQSSYRLTHLREYLAKYSTQQLVQPAESSWGEGGYNAVWLDDNNSWIYPKLHRAAGQMIRLAQEYPEATGWQQRALNQAARELMLAQASDWAFMIYTDTTVDYATERTESHLSNFDELRTMIEAGGGVGSLDPICISRLEAKNNLFAAMDYRVYGE